MEAAMKAVEEGTTVSEAARVYNVPRKTLNDQVRNHVQHGSTGPSQLKKRTLWQHTCCTWPKEGFI